MAQIDLGKLKFQWRGNYADSTAYEVDDVVFDKGTTWIVVSAVANSNTTDPEANNKFERMSSGYNYRAAYSGGTIYYYNDLVLESNSVYRYISNAPSSGNPVSNTTYWQSFIPNAAGNSLSQAGDILVQSNALVASRLGIGTNGSQLMTVVDPLEDFPTHEKVDYSINTTGSNTAILTDQRGNNVGGGDNTTNASITLSRGRRYYFQVPTGATYSFKDSNAAGYSVSGSGGRIDPCTTGVGTGAITGGGVLLFHPNTDVVGFPTTGIVLRNESGGTDQVEITLVPLRFTPKYREDYKPTSIDIDFKESFSEVVPLACNGVNIYTVGVGTNYYMPPFLKRFGAGQNAGGSPKAGIYRSGMIIPRNKIPIMWGNFYHDGSNNYYYWHGKGGRDMQNQAPMTYHPKFPSFVEQAIAGNTDYAKFLTDRDGNDLGFTNKTTFLPIIEAQPCYYSMMTLSINGILFFSGYNNYGMSGNGNTNTIPFPVPVPFYDTDRSTQLTGANYPKIKQFKISGSGGDTSNSYLSCYAIDTEGYLYTWGYNGYGQLRTGNTTNNYYASRIAKTFFGNRSIVYMTVVGNQYASVYAITDDGRCWSWGQNDNGQLAIDNETDNNTPTDITAVAGSPLNGKRIRHVMGHDGGSSNVVRVWFLTTDGEVFYCGQNENYGNYSGAISSSSSVDLDIPTPLTDAASTINSDGQKVVAMYTSGGRYCTQWFITDGGNSGESASKCYACGNNSQGEMGAATSHTDDGNASGNWKLKEIEFDSGPPTFGSNTGQVVGTRSTFLPGGANEGKMHIGRIVKVIEHAWASNTTFPVMALDEFGQVFVCGEWAAWNPAAFYNNDNSIDFHSTNDFTTRFVKCYTQPEPFIDLSFYNKAGEAEVSYMGVGESGTVYVGGYGGWSNLGNKTNYSIDAFLKLHET